MRAYDGACPQCGGELARVFNPAGIVFKGSGFYVNDSRKPASDASSGSGSSDSKPSGTADAKPSGATDAKPSGSTDSGSKKSESSAA